MQECTQIGENGLSEPFRGICVHCCAAASGRGYAGVYTNRRKWPLGAVLGHLCTLLRRCGQTWGRRSVHKSAKMASRRRLGALVYTVTPLRADVGTQECTQIGEDGLSEPFRGICVHCCAAAGRRGDAGVYTDRRRWALGATTARMQNAPFGGAHTQNAPFRESDTPRVRLFVRVTPPECVFP